MKTIIIIMCVCLVCVCAIVGYNKYQEEKERKIRQEWQEELELADKKYREYQQKISVLIDAVNKGDAEKIKRLIKEGADVNGAYNISLPKYSSKQRRPLITAISKGNTEIVKLLIELGADVNAREEIGSIYDRIITPALIVAVRHGYTEIVKLLIEAGADVNIKEIKYIPDPSGAHSDGPGGAFPDLIPSEELSLSVLQQAISERERINSHLNVLDVGPSGREKISKLRQQIKDLDEIIELLKAAGAKE